MNKKAQYYPKPSYTHLSPLLIIGIVLLCIPVILNIFRVTLPDIIKGILYVVGILGILGGALMSMLSASGD